MLEGVSRKSSRGIVNTGVAFMPTPSAENHTQDESKSMSNGRLTQLHPEGRAHPNLRPHAKAATTELDDLAYEGQAQPRAFPTYTTQRHSSIEKPAHGNNVPCNRPCSVWLKAPVGYGKHRHCLKRLLGDPLKSLL